MALRFAASGRYVSHGSAAALDNLGAAAFSAWAWVLRTENGGNQEILTKDGAFPSGWNYLVDNSSGEGELRLVVFRSSTDATWTDYIAVAGTVPLNVPTFVCSAYSDADTVKASLYKGHVDCIAAEVSYSRTQNGSGASAADATYNLYAGNLQRATTVPFQGLIGPYGLINRRITLAEAEYLRRVTLRRATRMMARLPGTQLLVFPENAGAPQIDWSGNGNAGTVTAATDYADFVRAPSNERRKLWIPVGAAAIGRRFMLFGVGR